MQNRLRLTLVWALLSFLVVFGGLSAPAAVATSRSSDPAQWAQDAVIYGVAPWYISKTPGARFKALTARLPELRELGVNTLWLQPVYENHDGGQGYDVTDYYKVWPELGTEADLKRLVQAAHKSGMRVIFDFVANHTSIHHPWAVDAIRKGHESKFYDYYVREKDRAPYSEHYNIRREGKADFVFYFWPHLPNLNYNNKDVVDHVTGAAEHWVKDYDIDGYRFDAAWTLNARAPGYWPYLFRRLRSIKRDLFFLAEDKAPRPDALRGTKLKASNEIFDAVYDWTGSRQVIAEWNWQRDDDNMGTTLFNAVDEDSLAAEVRKTLAVYTRQGSQRAHVLRFLENNDTPRFTTNHTPNQTKLAATIMFTAPGIPLIFYGQEIGVDEEFPSFDGVRRIRDRDRHGIWPHYQRLIALRAKLPELRRGEFTEVKVSPSASAKSVYTFARTLPGRATFSVLNLSGRRQDAEIHLGQKGTGLDPDRQYEIIDWNANKTKKVSGSEIQSLKLRLNGHEARILSVRAVR